MAIIFSVGATVYAGEHSSLHLTGNPTIDFFGKNTPVFNPISFSDTDKAPTRPQPSMPTLLWESGKREKSPWLAGLFSLAVPGAGEVYAGSYVKGAAFFAAEAASWILAYTYDKKGDRQTDLFQNYANEHWSAVRYVRFIGDHLGELTNGELTWSDYEDEVFNDRYYNVDTPYNCRPPFRCIDWSELNRLESDIANGRTNGFTHVLPYYGEQQYYELIGKYHQFSRGWDDADTNDAATPLRSNSRRFYEYAAMRAKANDYYSIASTFVSVAVVNHFLSALDAFWTATQYNKNLYAEVRMRVVPTPYGVVPVAVTSVKYTF